MKVQVKTFSNDTITLGQSVGTKPYDIQVDALPYQSVTILDGIITEVDTYKYLSDLIEITDLAGTRVSFDAKKPTSELYKLLPLITVRTTGIGHLNSVNRKITGTYIELTDNNNRVEILIDTSNNKCETKVYME